MGNKSITLVDVTHTGLGWAFVEGPPYAVPRDELGQHTTRQAIELVRKYVAKGYTVKIRGEAPGATSLRDAAQPASRKEGQLVEP